VNAGRATSRTRLDGPPPGFDACGCRTGPDQGRSSDFLILLVMSPSGWLLSLSPVTSTNTSAAWNDRSTNALRRARHQREDGLRRVRSITRSIAIASVTAAVAAGVYVSRALPGHSSTPTNTSTNVGVAPTPSGSSEVSPAAGAATSPGNQSSSSLSPPSNAPAQAQQPAPVVSGAT
jgi:hypothetical protein